MGFGLVVRRKILSDAQQKWKPCELWILPYNILGPINLTSNPSPYPHFGMKGYLNKKVTVPLTLAIENFAQSWFLVQVVVTFLLRQFLKSYQHRAPKITRAYNSVPRSSRCSVQITWITSVSKQIHPKAAIVKLWRIRGCICFWSLSSSGYKSSWKL